MENKRERESGPKNKHFLITWVCLRGWTKLNDAYVMMNHNQRCNCIKAKSDMREEEIYFYEQE